MTVTDEQTVQELMRLADDYRNLATADWGDEQKQRTALESALRDAIARKPRDNLLEAATKVLAVTEGDGVLDEWVQLREALAELSAAITTSEPDSHS